MNTEEIKKLIGTGQLIIGSKLTIKNLKKGEIRNVFLTTNCSAEAKADIEQYAKLGGVSVESAEIESEELGVLCKRRHSVSVLGVKK